MAPNLAAEQHAIIEASSIDPPLPSAVAAETARCTPRAVNAIRANLRAFGTTKAPFERTGRPRLIKPAMLNFLKERLRQEPGLTLEEMVELVVAKFETVVSTATISRALNKIGWSKKVIRRKAKEQNADLRDMHSYLRSEFHSFQLVYIDESGCDRRVGNRRTGWSAVGTTPVEITPFQRGQRYQILAAYAQDGILHSTVFAGPTSGSVFEDFLEQLLPRCGRFPAPKSVLVMDNASFHHSENIERMCAEAGVKLLYLSPYSPDFNPIEEFFAELKAFMKKKWNVYVENMDQGFKSFIEWSVDVVGLRGDSAKGHFRNAGIEVEDY